MDPPCSLSVERLDLRLESFHPVRQQNHADYTSSLRMAPTPVKPPCTTTRPAQWQARIVLLTSWVVGERRSARLEWCGAQIFRARAASAV